MNHWLRPHHPLHRSHMKACSSHHRSIQQIGGGIFWMHAKTRGLRQRRQETASWNIYVLKNKLDVKIFPQKNLDTGWTAYGRIKGVFVTFPCAARLAICKNASGNVALSRWWNIIHIDGITCSNSWYCRWNFRLSSWNCRLRRYCRSCLAVRLATCISSKAWSAYSLSIAVAYFWPRSTLLRPLDFFSGLQHLPIGAAISHPRLVSLGPLLPVRPVWKGGKEKFLPGEYKQRKTPETNKLPKKKQGKTPEKFPENNFEKTWNCY